MMEVNLWHPMLSSTLITLVHGATKRLTLVTLSTKSQAQKSRRMKLQLLWLNPSTSRQHPLQCPKDFLPVPCRVACLPLAHYLEVSHLPVCHPLGYL
jgi:hypothetical protein